MKDKKEPEAELVDYYKRFNEKNREETLILTQVSEDKRLSEVIFDTEQDTQMA